MVLFDSLSDLYIIASIFLLLLYPSAYLLKYYKNKKSLRNARDHEEHSSPSNPAVQDSELTKQKNIGATLNDQWVQIYRALDNSEAHLIRGMLEANDIPCFLKGDQHRSLLGWQAGILIPVDVWVPRAQAEKAKEMIHPNASQELQD